MPTTSSERVTRPRGRTTTEDHLRRADPVLGALIDDVLRESGCIRPKLPPDPARAVNPDIPAECVSVLVRAIVSQNVSNFVARSSFRRLTARFGGRPPTPQELLADDPDQLRQAAGLSRAKTASLLSLAEHILSGDLDLNRLHELPDQDVIAELVAVKGIGDWTADMFLMFHLYRPDVLPVGDLELRNTVATVYGLPARPTPAELERIAEPWRPRRTLACIYLWQWAEKTSRV